MSGEHSPLAPSSSARRIQCSASTTMEARIPQGEDSPDAAAGTAAHWGVAEMLAGRMIDKGLLAPNGVFLTDEMIEAAELMFDDLAAELKPYGLSPSQGSIEQPVAIPRIHAQSWGTPDYRIWLTGVAPRKLRLLVYDFKFGHRIVDVFECAQLIEYVAGALDEVKFEVNDLEIDVTVKIVQPRAPHKEGPVRSWSFNASDIRGHINVASYAAHEALGANPVARVGEECRDCKARHQCPTLDRAALAGCDVAGAAQPFDLTPTAMALEYRVLRHYEALMHARATGLEEQLLALGKQGNRLPGLALEHGAGRERWTIPDVDVIAIGAALGVNVAKPPEALTPNQALRAGLSPAVLPGLVNTPRGKAKLVDDDGTLARRIFG